MRKLLLFFFCLSSISLVGCADRQYENYNMTAADITLSSNNHPHGYNRSDCFLCHLPMNIHQVDRLGAPSFPFAKGAVERNGLNSCRGCHGSNGVPP
jgi:hypothetical protein